MLADKCNPLDIWVGIGHSEFSKDFVFYCDRSLKANHATQWIRDSIPLQQWIDEQRKVSDE